MKKRLFAVVAVAIACAACDTQLPSNNTTTPATTTTMPPEADAMTSVLNEMFVRTKLSHLERSMVILQPMATIPTLTFNLGSACSGQIEMPDETKYVIEVFTRDPSVTIVDITLPVGYPGKLSDSDIEQVAGKCPA